MSITVTLTTPAAASYDLVLAANYRFGIAAAELPDLEQRIEQEGCQFEAGELELECRNDDGWWDTILDGADRFARYPDTFVIVVARDGVTRWEGDIDLLSVSYDRAARTVSFTVTGKLARLSRYSAEGVRRAYPRYSDWNSAADSTAAVALTLDAGPPSEDQARAIALDADERYAYLCCNTSPVLVVKVDLSNFTRVAVLALTGVGDLARGAVIEGDYLYVSCYTAPATLVRIALSTFTVIDSISLGVDYALNLVSDGTSLYASTYEVPAQIVKVDIATFAVTGTLELTANENYGYGLAVSGGYAYVGCYVSTPTAAIVTKVQTSDMTRIGIVTLSAGENDIRTCTIDSAGENLYVCCYTSPIKVVKIELTGFTRSAVMSMGENQALAAVRDNEDFLYVATTATPGKIGKVQLAALPTATAFTEVDVVTLGAGQNDPSTLACALTRGALVVASYTAPSIADLISTRDMTACYAVTDAAKSWPVDQFVNHVLISSSTVYVIVGNSATILLVSGNASAAAAYRIRPSAWTTYVDPEALPRKMTSLGPSVAQLGLLPEDKLAITRIGATVSRIQYQPKRGFYYEGTYETSQQTVAVKHVGAKTYPSLTAHEIGVDTDLTIDMELGDHVANITPYHRTKTIAELVALLFAEAEVDASEYEIDVPTLANNVVTYADFDGMNVGDALIELAKLAGCTISVTPTQYLFQRRDVVASTAGAGGSLDLIVAADSWNEDPIADQSYDYVRMEGANDTNVTRGLVSFGANDLKISSDWIHSYDWLKQSADRNWQVFGGQRKSASVKVLDGFDQNAVADPSFEGTAALGDPECVWEVVTAAGASEALEKSTTYASHMRQSLHLKTIGTQLHVRQLLMAQFTVEATSSSGLLLTYGSVATPISHDIPTYSKVRFSTTGTLPTGLETGVDYWTVEVSASTCRVATSLENAVAATVIAYTDAGTGTHTLTFQGAANVAVNDVLRLSGTARVVDVISALGYAMPIGGMLHLDLYGLDAAGAIVLPGVATTYWSKRYNEFVTKVAALKTVPETCAVLWARIWAGASSQFDAYIDEIKVERTNTPFAPCLLQRVTLGSEMYVVTAIREALRPTNAPSVMDLELIGTTVTEASSGYDTSAEDSTPPKPVITSVTKIGNDPGVSTEYTSLIDWPFPDAPVARLLRTVWNITADRPDNQTDVALLERFGDADTFRDFDWFVMSDVAANTKFVDYVVLYADGRISEPSDPYILPASS